MSQRPFHHPPRAVPDAPADEMRPALPLETILQDWPGALARVTAYLRAIGFASADVRRLAARAVERALGRQRTAARWPTRSTRPSASLLETQPLAGDGRGEGRLAAFARWRFAAFQAGTRARPTSSSRCSRSRPSRRCCAARWCPRSTAGGGSASADIGAATGDRYPEHERPGRRERRGAREPWDARGRRRRALLFLLVLAPSIVAGA